jgi:PAS domain S-box-containing protein
MNFNLFHRLSLKTRVTFFSLAIFIASIWSLTFYTSKMLRQDIQQMLSDQQFSTASFVAGEINQELENRLTSLEEIASYLSPAMQSNSMTLQPFLKQRTVFQNLFNAGTFVTSLDGIVIADVPVSAERLGVNFMDRDYMQAVLKEGKAKVGRPVMGKKLMAPAFAMAVPIRDAQGKVIGALAGATDLSKPNFLDKIAQNNYGKTGGYLLAAPQYKLYITGTDKSRIMQPTPAPGVNPLLDRYMQGFEGSGVVIDSHGTEVLSSAKQILAVGWLLVARIPTAEAFAPIRTMQQRMLLIAIFMTMLAGSLTWLMLRRQLAPLLAAVNILSTQANTSLPSQPLPVTHHDEIGELIDGFNRLLETLGQKDKALRASRQQLSNIIEFLPNPTMAIDNNGRVIIWNKAIEAMTGITAAEMIGKGDHAYMIPFYGEARVGLLNLIFADDEEITSRYPDITRQGDTVTAEAFCNALYGNKGAWIFGKALPLRDQDGNVIGAIESVRDISARKLSEMYGIMSREVLQILNKPGCIQESAQRVLAVMKKLTGLDAVGIRLQEGDDFPYLAQEGFSKEFLRTENSLSGRTIDVNVCRNEDGSLRLECTCGLVISGMTDPAGEFFTSGGSFWTNNSLPLLDIPSSEDPRHHPRNHCIHQGYLSVALVPIRNQARVIGLIQLNDRRQGCFTVDTVELLERIATHIGEALVRKQAEEALKKSEARYTATLSVLETGLWDWHIPSGQATFSAVYYRILGYENGGFPASYDSWRNLVHPEDLGLFEKRLERSFELGKGFTFDIRMKMKSGDWKWVSLRGRTSERDTKGRALQVVGTLTDITERKMAEKERKTMQAQLQQAQKMEAIGTLAGGIAHDFNNILAAILGYAEMARENSQAGSLVANDIVQVVKASHRAKELVKQILAFSRQDETERIPLDPSLIIKEASKMLRSSLPATIDIRMDLDKESGLVLADPTQIHQILMNLCTNAYHAMEDTGGTLSISLKKESPIWDDLVNEPGLRSGNFVRLSVSDTGLGIAPEIREKIFEPYFTTKPIGKGTGMGLSIINGIVRSYGGVVSCYSQPGKGTCFHVYLPVIAETELSEIKQENPIQSGNEHILFIDDESIIADMGKSMLTKLGYQVTTRTSSLEALTTFQNQPEEFDLVITDQTMPEMTGSDLARHMLQIRPEIPIILCTGYSSQITEENAMSYGIKGYAIKPIARKDIAALIRKVLDVAKSIS